MSTNTTAGPSSVWRFVTERLKEASVLLVVPGGIFYEGTRPVFYVFLITAGAVLVYTLYRRLVTQGWRQWLKLTLFVVLREQGHFRLNALGVVPVLVLPIAGWLAWGAYVDCCSARDKMDGDVNVLVAPFASATSGGGLEATSRGHDIKREIVTGLQRYGRAGIVEVEPLDTIVVDDQAALQIAEEKGAHLVIFGELDAKERLRPSIVLAGEAATRSDSSTKRLVPRAVAIGGAAGGEGLDSLLADIDTVIGITYGLVDLQEGDQDAAISQFLGALDGIEAAAGPPRDPADIETTKAFVHLLLGTAYLERDAPGDDRRAQDEFRNALRFRPTYARPWLGLGNLYLRWGVGSGDPALTEDTWIELARESYAYARDSGDADSIALSKAHIGVGNAELVLGQLGGADHYDQAEEAFGETQQLADKCERHLRWWNPMAWGPWNERFKDRSPECDELRALAELAEYGLALVDESRQMWP